MYGIYILNRICQRSVVVLSFKMATLRMKIVIISVVVLLVVAGAIVGIVFALKGCTGTPSIRDLVIKEENGKITLEWKVENSAENCVGAYTVTGFVEDEIVIDFYTEQPKLTIEYVIPCAIITFEVAPQSTQADPGETLKGTFETDPGKVDEFEIKHVGSNLLFSWFAPENSKYCKYGITFDDEVLVNNLLALTYNYDIHLNTIPLQTCTKNTYSIFTVGQGSRVGGPVKLEYTVGVVSEVRNIRIIEDTKTFLVTWEMPENIELCTAQEFKKVSPGTTKNNITSLANYLYYNVVYREGLQIKSEKTTINPNAIFLKETSDCSGYTIEITTEFGESDGPLNTENRIAGIQAITVANVVEENNKLTVSWELVENSTVCSDVEYKVKYSEGANYQEITTSEFECAFELESDICTTVNISVIPILGDFKGDETIKVIPVIKDLLITGENGQMTLVWEVEDSRKNCVLNNEVMYYINGVKIQSNHTDEPTFTFENVEHCALMTVKIVPISVEEYPEEPLIGTFESDTAGQVDDFVIKLDGANLVFSWTAPKESKYCKYRIDFDGEEFLNDLLGETYSYNVDLNNSPLQSCSSNTYSIFTVGQGSKVGTPVELEYTTGVLTEVGNIEMIENKDENTLHVTWESPKNIELCTNQFMRVGSDLIDKNTLSRANSLSYTVVYKDGNREDIKNSVDDTTVTFNTFETSDCSPYTIQITTNFDNTEGRSRIEKRNAGVSAVTITHILEVNDELKVSWEPADTSIECNGIKYIVTYTEGAIYQETKTGELECTFDLVSAVCTTVKISVIPVIGDSEGEETLEFHVVTSGLTVTALTIYQVGELLKVTWRAPSNADACTELKYKVIYSDTTGPIKEETDLIDVSHDFIMVTSPCIPVTMSVTPFNGEVMGLEKYQSHNVRIGEVGRITIIQRCDANIFITWDAPQDILSCGIVTYVVTYFEDGEERGKRQTTDLLEYFPISRTTECIYITVRILPYSGITDGKSKFSEVFNANEGMCTPV